MTASTRWVVLKFGGTSVSRRTRWDTIGRLAAKRVQRRGRACAGGGLGAVGRHQRAAGDRERRATATWPARRSPRSSSAIAHFCANSISTPMPCWAIASPRCTRWPPIRAPRHGALDWQAEVLAQGELLSSTLGAAYLRAQGIDIGWCDARDWLRRGGAAEPERLGAAAVGQLPPPQPTPAGARVSRAQPTRHAAHPGLHRAPWRRRHRDARPRRFGYLGGLFRRVAGRGARRDLDRRARHVQREPARGAGRAPAGAAGLRRGAGNRHHRRQGAAPAFDRALPRRAACRWRSSTPSARSCRARASMPRAATVPGVKAISRRNGIVLVSMESVGMWQQVGFLADVFERFKRHGLSVDLIGSSETNVTVSLDPSENLVTTDVLDALSADLAQVCRVKVIAPVRGDHAGRPRHALAAAQAVRRLGEFGRERVHLISQSSNDLNLTFVVDEADADGMLPQLHAELMRSGAMPVRGRERVRPELARDRARAPPSARAPWWRGAARRACWRCAAARHAALRLPPADGARARARAARRSARSTARYYAIKANAHPAILRALEAEGFGLECVSQGEARARVRDAAGAARRRACCSRPSFAPRARIRGRVRRAASTSPLDNVEPLRHWPDVFRGRDAVAARRPRATATATTRRCAPAAAEAEVRPAGRSAWTRSSHARAPLDVRITGLHAHLGSGIDDPRALARRVCASWRRCPTHRQRSTRSTSAAACRFRTAPTTQPFDLDAWARGAGRDQGRVPALRAGDRAGPLSWSPKRGVLLRTSPR